MKPHHVTFAQQFVAVHRDNRRFHPKRGRWMAWERGCWSVSCTPLNDMASIIAAIVSAKNRSQWVRVSHCRGALDLAAERLREDGWDADPDVLGLPDGRVVDLRTGRTRAQRFDDWITMTAGCDRIADDPSDMWEKFVLDCCGTDQVMADALQLAIGASAFGHNEEHRVEIVCGDGGTGKTTFSDTIREALGDYAGTLPASVLNAKSEQHPTGIAGLLGKRFAVAPEVSGGTFKSETLKAISGGDTLPARFMRQDFFDFRPAATIWIITNESPGVRMVDNALRRRLRLWPFEAKPERPDPKLPARLRSDELPGVLRWIVQGAMSYAAGGLRDCRAVLDATAAYFESTDTLTGWFEARCERSEITETPSRFLFKDYQDWCQAEGVRAVSRTAWGIWMGRRVEKRHGKRGNVYTVAIVGEQGEGVNGFSI